MARVLVPLADGCEELEAVAIIDTLRRAEWDVVVAGLKEGTVTASRGVKLVPDTTLDEVDLDSFDLVVLPGGNNGVVNLMADERILGALRRFRAAGKTIAAVCAAPLVLQKAGVIDGMKMTCYPSVAPQITKATRLGDKVVIDGKLITSQGPGTSIAFALAIIEHVDGREKSARVAEGMVAIP
ncbi:MAG TPA: DJ-1 family glyoxalase III [Kiritimatiellia bacterium]|jgi:4-methyl-5(b-hydroxyethyl)-thiazole monophosphate biosynthesis